MKPKVGLLPLYLKLYDDTMPEIRGEFEGLLRNIENRLRLQGLDVETAQICRIRPEVSLAVRRFESLNAHLLVTVHLAYSPSLEAAEVLASSSLPLLMLDTTMDYEFSQRTDPQRLMYNHGVHGVQDLASMLIRLKRRFQIIAGHVDSVELFERAARHARAACAAYVFRSTRALRIGESFQGMGDFAVDEAVLKRRFGIGVNQAGLDEVVASAKGITDEAVNDEVERDNDLYNVVAPTDVHRRSVRVGLALRAMLDSGSYSAFSMNFLAFNKNDGPIDTVPFLEASKSMARGAGYAGEGDVLTASLVGALQNGIGPTTFTEIFCPHWKSDSMFISHMGEVNPATAADKPLLCEKDFPWTGALNPAILACAPQHGPAVLVNLAPGPDDTFSLILAYVNVNSDSVGSSFKNWVRGWLTPNVPLAHFLEEYSRMGGTHHSALVLGSAIPELTAFAFYAGIDSVFAIDGSTTCVDGIVCRI